MSAIPSPAPKPSYERTSSGSLTVSSTNYPNLFMSPFGNDGVIVSYSSIPIQSSDAQGDCLPCIICGNSTQISEILAIEATRLQSNFASGVTVSKI